MQCLSFRVLRVQKTKRFFKTKLLCACSDVVVANACLLLNRCAHVCTEYNSCVLRVLCVRVYANPGFPYPPILSLLRAFNSTMTVSFRTPPIPS